MAWYMLCASKLFPTARSPSCTHTVQVIIVGMYAFESRIQKVIIEPPDIVEWLAGNQLSTIFVLQIFLQMVQQIQLFSYCHCHYLVMIL